jgi:hypothetical protein
MALECPEGAGSLRCPRLPPIRGIYRATAPLSDFAPVCVRGPMLIRSPFFSRIGRLDGPPTSDESFIFLLEEELSRPEAG